MNVVLLASLILTSVGTFWRIWAPSLNLRLLTQLELSVKASSPTWPTPPLRVIECSPLSNGLLPSLSRMIFALKSFSVQSSCSSDPKSPSRTTILIFVKDSGSVATILFVLASSSSSLMGLPSSVTILQPVKMVEGKFPTNRSSRPRSVSTVPIVVSKDLQRKPIWVQYTGSKSLKLLKLYS